MILKATTCHDYRFIQIISPKISEISNLSSADPVSVHPLFFQNLKSVIHDSWLLKCAVDSYTNYSEQGAWNPESIEKSIEKINIDNLDVNTLFHIIEPLLLISELFEYLSRFTLSKIIKFTTTIPLKWFTWFLVECDSHKNFDYIAQVVHLLNDIITVDDINQVPIKAFNPESLLLFFFQFNKATFGSFG
ncbi:hypothetical protein RCL1_000053 [Eukaryota sp. TZLM3-RCL]